MKFTNRKALAALAGQPHRPQPFPKLVLGGLLVEMTPEVLRHRREGVPFSVPNRGCRKGDRRSHVKGGLPS